MTIIARRKLINTSILVMTTYSLFCATTSDHEWKEEKLKQVVFLITWTFYCFNAIRLPFSGER